MGIKRLLKGRSVPKNGNAKPQEVDSSVILDGSEQAAIDLATSLNARYPTADQGRLAEVFAAIYTVGNVLKEDTRSVVLSPDLDLGLRLPAVGHVSVGINARSLTEGKASLELITESGTGLFGLTPDPVKIQLFQKAGGKAPPLCWARAVTWNGGPTVKIYAVSPATFEWTVKQPSPLMPSRKARRLLAKQVKNGNVTFDQLIWAFSPAPFGRGGE